MPRVIDVQLEADETDFTILVTRKTDAYASEIDGVCTLQGELEDGRVYNVSVTDAISARTFTMPLSGKYRP